MPYLFILILMGPLLLLPHYTLDNTKNLLAFKEHIFNQRVTVN